MAGPQKQPEIHDDNLCVEKAGRTEALDTVTTQLRDLFVHQVCA